MLEGMVVKYSSSVRDELCVFSKHSFLKEVFKRGQDLFLKEVAGCTKENNSQRSFGHCETVAYLRLPFVRKEILIRQEMCAEFIMITLTTLFILYLVGSVRKRRLSPVVISRE